MREDLEKQLYEKYPKIFAQKDLPMSQTCMNWGICVSDGWYDLIDTLCRNIQGHIDQENRSIQYKKEKGQLPPDAPEFPQVEATQVKEKFGGLRFYVNHYDDYVSGLIAMAESMSYSLCESCGRIGKANDEGWIAVLCPDCRTKDDERLRKLNEEAQARLTVKMKDVTVAP